MSNLADAGDRIRGAWSALQAEWGTAREHWRDAIGDNFERNVWQPWEDQVPQLLEALEDLNQILDHAIAQTE